MSECGDSNIKKSYIVQAFDSADIFSACTAFYTNQILPCTGNTVNVNGNLLVTGDTEVTGDILPTNDNNSNLGSPVKRFRDINTVSGTSTVWTSSIKVITPTIDLGLDSLGNNRTITANNSVIQNDILNGGQF